MYTIHSIGRWQQKPTQLKTTKATCETPVSGYMCYRGLTVKTPLGNLVGFLCGYEVSFKMIWLTYSRNYHLLYNILGVFSQPKYTKHFKFL